MSKRQQVRAEIVGRLSAGGMSKIEAGLLLGLGRRQVDRVLSAYRDRGIASVVHGNAGRVPVNKTPPEVLAQVVSLVGEGGKYHDFAVSHACDQLEENEAIRIGRSTLDRLLRSEGIICSRESTNKTKRKRRQRASAEGAMLQIDASPHDWLEARGPKMALVGAVDDATGKIVYGVFRPTEDLPGYLMMLRGISRTYGLPESVYHDRHTILRSPKAATIQDELAGTEPQSQFQRVLSELGITSIAAGSPQAKGRIERVWRTLQNRLVKEMRLAQVSTIEQANAFMPGFINRYNKRFGREPADQNTAWVKMEPNTDLDYYFCARESRIVRSDHTIAWQGKTLQITLDSRSRSLASVAVNVHQTPEGDILLYDGKRRLQYRCLPSLYRKPTQAKPRPTARTPDPSALARRRAWLFAQSAA